MGRGVTPLLWVALIGCRQVFGIEDTRPAMDATILVDGVAGAPDATELDGPTLDAPPAVLDAPDDECPVTYTLMAGGRRYRVVTQETSWAGAVQDCGDDGALLTHLAVPDDLVENALITGFITGQSWIGISDVIVETQYQTVTGMPVTFFNWENGEPDNEDDEDCVNMRDSNSGQPGAWRDDLCGSNRRYICECPG
jgi:hypothetical protein